MATVPDPLGGAPLEVGEGGGGALGGPHGSQAKLLSMLQKLLVVTPVSRICNLSCECEVYILLTIGIGVIGAGQSTHLRAASILLRKSKGELLGG